jgi:hypothetical protein
MAFKIDTSTAAEEMKIEVVFKHLNGVEIIKTPDPESINEKPWLVDSLGDLPCAGDWIVLPDFRNNEEMQSSVNGYKVVGRHIDFSNFAGKGARIYCTVLVEAGTE